MDFTTQRILLGAAGGAEPDTYFYAYISNLNQNEGLNNIAIDDTNGDVFLSWRSNVGTGTYSSYDAHDIAQIDKEGSKVTIVKNTHTPNSSNGGRGVAIKSNGHAVALSRGGGRYGVTTINMGSPSVVSQVFPAPSSNYRSVEANQIFEHSNNIYLCGRWAYSSSRGANIVKLNSSNTIQWSAYLNTSYGYTSYFTQGDNGDIAIIGTNSGGSTSMYVAKINSSGSFVCGALIQHVGDNEADVAIDSNGDIIAITAGSKYAGYRAGILCKFNGSNGNLIWSREINKFNTNFFRFAIDVGADGTIHIICMENYSNGYFRYMRINSSGTKTYDRRISTTFSNLVFNAKLVAKNKNIYIGLSSNYSSRAVFVLKLPDSGDITGSYNQVSITNTGSFFAVQSVGSDYAQTGTSTPTFQSYNWTVSNYTSNTQVYLTSSTSVSYPQTNSVTSSGYPLSHYNYSDYTLPL